MECSDKFNNYDELLKVFFEMRNEIRIFVIVNYI